MDLCRQYRPELVCSQDKHRFALQEPHLDTERKLVVATNGKALMAFPCDELVMGEASGPIPLTALKTARKEAPRHGPIRIELNGDAKVLPGPISFPRPVMGEFPDYAPFIKTEVAEPHVEVSLDAFLLADVVKAASGRGIVRLSFRVRPIQDRKGVATAREGGIVLKIAGQEEVQAVLMPVI